MNRLPTYQCFKRVKAMKIASVSIIKGEGDVEDSAILKPVDSTLTPIKVGREYLAKHQPDVGGYFVLYEDGYQSYSPAEAFESGYYLSSDD